MRHLLFSHCSTYRNAVAAHYCNALPEPPATIERLHRHYCRYLGRGLPPPPLPHAPHITYGPFHLYPSALCAASFPLQPPAQTFVQNRIRLRILPGSWFTTAPVSPPCAATGIITHLRASSSPHIASTLSVGLARFMDLLASTLGRLFCTAFFYRHLRTYRRTILLLCPYRRLHWFLRFLTRHYHIRVWFIAWFYSSHCTPHLRYRTFLHMTPGTWFLPATTMRRAAVHRLKLLHGLSAIPLLRTVAT